MKLFRLPTSIGFSAALAFVTSFVPVASQAQTWSATAAGSSFNTGSNWVGGSVPSANGNLVFSATSTPSVFLSASYSANSLTFSGSYPNYFFGTSNGSVLTIGSGGVTLNNTGTGTPSPGFADFGSLLNLSLAANQTWTTNGNMRVQGGISGSNLTKAGTGYLELGGTNSFASLTVSAGTVYLGQGSAAGAGSLGIATGATLGAVGGELSLSNTLNLSHGASINGNINGDHADYQFSNVTLSGATPTVNVANSDVFISGALSASSATDLTVHSDGTGVVILAGTQSNISSITAEAAAVTFGNAGALPATLHATDGGYIGIADAELTTPDVAVVLGKITDKTTFNGILGFDTSDEHSSGVPTNFSADINLTGFVDGQVRLGSLTTAILSGTITPPAQIYDFAGYASQDGALIVQSNLADSGGATGMSVVSPNSSGGAAQDGLVVVLQGNNSFTGGLSTAYSSVILDSANALPAAGNFALGDHSYVGYTESATGFTTFADFAARRTSHTSTSILGLDSANVISAVIGGGGGSVRTFSGTVDLSALSPIFLGTLTGVTIDSSATLKASNDGALRLVSMNGENGMIIDAKLDSTYMTSLVVGLPGSEGVVRLNNAENDYTGGTTLQGGALLVGHDAALSSGAVTVNATSGDRVVLGAATNGRTITNNIAVTNGVTLGLADYDGGFTAGANQLTVNGVISGSGHVATEAPTVLGGTNTHTGGTTIWADTTVNNAAGLGATTHVVDVGRGAVLTFNTATPSIGSLASSSQFDSSAGTGTINLGSAVLTINQATNYPFSGVISGTGGITKAGSATLTLSASNTYTGVTTLTAGTLSVSSIGNGGVAGGLGAATNAAANLVFNGTSGGGALMYTGSTASTDRNFTINDGKAAIFAIANSGTTLTLSGSSTSTSGGLVKNGPGTLTLSGTNLHTGVTTLNGGTLSVSSIGDGGTAGNLGAASNAAGNLVFSGNGNGAGTLMYTGATASTDRNFTVTANRTAVINISNSSTNLTINGGSASTNGAFVKTGAGTLTLGGVNLITGATTVSAGTLRVDGSLSGSALTVSNGATLGGSGTVGAVAISSGGTLAPGSSAGLLNTGNLSLLGTTMMEIGGTTRGTDYDAIDVTGTIAFGGTLSVSLINGYSPVSGASFDLFNWTVGSPSGSFTLNLPALSGGLTWDSSALASDGVLSVSAIPEPGTYAAIAAAFVLGVAIWRRRCARPVAA